MRRAGRPPTADPTLAVTARLPRSTVEALDALLRERRAETPAITRQDLLREAVGRFLAAEKRKARRSGACQFGRVAGDDRRRYAPGMSAIVCRGFWFPWIVIQHAVWLYARFTLSLRDVEELLAERGIVVSHETVRAWVARFGPPIARKLRARRGRSNGPWHLDEMFVSIGGRRRYLWRAVDGVGEILDVLVQARRDKHAALRLMRKLLKKQGMAPATLVTDRLGSYAAAARDLGLSGVHVRSPGLQISETPICR
jgi:transposase-like protein